jgi:hypothetical protein
MKLLCTLILLTFYGLFFPNPGWSEMYYWVDDQGIENYTGRLESIPEEYRSKAQQLSLPPAPSFPPDLKTGQSPKKLTRIPFSPGSPILVQVKINHVGPIPLILDTGAERSVISTSVLSRLGLSAVNEPPVIVKGVTGTGYANRVLLESIEVGEISVGPLLIAVYSADLRGADGLLGRDFLSNLNVTIDSKEKVVTLTTN